MTISWDFLSSISDLGPGVCLYEQAGDPARKQLPYYDRPRRVLNSVEAGPAGKRCHLLCLRGKYGGMEEVKPSVPPARLHARGEAYASPISRITVGNLKYAQATRSHVCLQLPPRVGI